MSEIKATDVAVAQEVNDIPAVVPEDEPKSDESATEEEDYHFAAGKDGTVCEVKNLIGRYDNDGDWKIVENDKDENEEKEDDPHSKFAILQTRHYNSEGIYDYTNLEFKSPYIKRLLRKVISYYPGESMDSNPIEMRSPPQPIFHFLPEIENYIDSESDEEIKKHGKLLIDTSMKLLGKDMQKFDTLVRKKRITFKLAWMLFKPGDVVYFSTDGHDRAMLVYSVQYHETECGNMWQISGEWTDYDGTTVGRSFGTTKIPEFKGDLLITSLPVYPIKYVPQANALKKTLIERGKRMLSFQGIGYHQYKGLAQSLQSPFRREPARNADSNPDDKRPYTTINVTGRIIVDNNTFGVENRGNRVRLSNISQGTCSCHSCTKRFKNSKPVFCICEDCKGSTKFCMKDAGKDDIDDRKDHHVELGDDDLLLCSPFVYGYSLQSKRWCQFHIDNISSVQLNEKAFDSLAIPPSYKRLVSSMVNTHVAGDTQFDDIIEGKGKSLIVLMYGPPGVGKTLTAESIADRTKRPLWSVSSGELGTDPADVEETLSRMLEIACAWKAIVLLDEADVFLQERNNTDINRNALVSIFLRLLEYYQGILFLTSNRVAQFDPAFKSRIHVALRYPDLTANVRRQIWKTFLDRVPKDRLDLDLEKDLNTLEQQNINGRQIKNTCKTALSLAISEGSKLGMEQIMTAVDTVLEFENEFQE